MLIDYHIHLERDIYFERCPYNSENFEGYMEVARERGIDELGITEHCNRFLEFRSILMEMVEVEGTHPAIYRWFEDMCTENLERYVSHILELKDMGYPVKLGIEVEFIPGRIKEIGEILAPYPWDFVLGSVHMLGNWAIDFSTDVGWPERDVDDAYMEYIETLTLAANSGLYDVLAHLDLVKKFAHRPKNHMRDLWLECLDVIAEKGLAIEVSTAGLRKAVKEMYPSEWLLTMSKERDIPITLASDAHDASEVGMDIDEAIQLAMRCGYNEVATFSERQIHSMPLGC
jgi:histidinol-phosphatase (PHP family)